VDRFIQNSKCIIRGFNCWIRSYVR